MDDNLIFKQKVQDPNKAIREFILEEIAIS